jgi:hypothetical protein
MLPDGFSGDEVALTVTGLCAECATALAAEDAGRPPHATDTPALAAAEGH